VNVLKRTIGVLVTVAVAAAATGCGSDDEGAPIPQDAAAALERQLESIQSRFEFGGGACADIAGGDDPNTVPIRQTLDSLPKNVDQDVRDALRDSFDRLFQLVDEQCDAEPEPQQTETEEEAPAETETVPPETTETEEAVPTETEEQTAPEEEQTAPEEEQPQEKTPPGQEKKQGELDGVPGGGESGGSGGALVPEDGG